MKKLLPVYVLLLTIFFSCSPKINKVVSVGEVERIERALSSDEMRGRKAFTANADRAAEFISAEFKKIGLEQFGGATNYKQPFTMTTPKVVSTSATFNGKIIDAKNVVVFTSTPKLEVTEQSGFRKVAIKTGSNFFVEARKYIQAKENVLVLVDTSFAANFNRLPSAKSFLFQSENSAIFVLTDIDPTTYLVTAEHEINISAATNVVGILPGKSKKDQYVIFSGHYDHLGIGKAVNGDSIYNGANDDAAGITAVITLAKYFKAYKNNECTLIFVAFTAEEIGGYGSQYFSKQLEADKVIAMFNIEMIGTESKWGKNSAYITGYDLTDMGQILGKNLKGTDFTFYPDPYIQQNLFYRSDNATLARLGVPAHTISTSKMDDEPNYHKVSDELETLDIKNMTEIIKAIVLSSKTIINGKDTPSRVKVAGLTR